MKLYALLLPAALLLAPRDAAAADGAPSSRDPEPSNGIGLIVTGAVVLGVAAVDGATGSASCLILGQSSATDTSSFNNVCWGVVIGFAGVGLAVGLPLLIMGLNDHSDHREWEKRHGIAGVSIVPIRSGAAVTWTLDL